MIPRLVKVKRSSYIFFLVILFLSISCVENNEKEQDIEAKPAIFRNAFIDGYTTYIDEKPSEFHCIEIGKIILQTGKVVCRSPFGVYDPVPIKHHIPPGKYPCLLSFVEIKEKDWIDKRIAFSKIQIRDKPPVKWVPTFGYPVDGATGSFMDLKTAYYLDRMSIDENWKFTEKISEELEKNYRSSYMWAIVPLNDGNIISFTTGWGDGYYDTYVGLDKNSDISEILTDFYMFPWKESWL